MPRSIICPYCQEFIEDAATLEAGPLRCPACAESIAPAKVEGQTPAWVAARRTELEGQGRLQRTVSNKPRNETEFITDVVIGPNMRWKDNLVQAIAILVSMVIGVVAGVLVSDDRFAGALVGALGGVIVGLFGSGIVLMIYRMIHH